MNSTRAVEAKPLSSGPSRSCACGGRCESCKRKQIQRKASGWSLGAANDPAEQEADRMADAALASGPMPALRAGRSGGGTGEGVDASLIDPVLGSSGSALPTTLRERMESRFGHDFSRVRIHADATAAESSAAVGARAYTAGQHLAFARGQYAPETAEGQRLVAHELAHVVQGGGTDPVVRRDLATEPPAGVTAEHVELTDAQVQSAIAFNRARYTSEHTKLIQDIVGTEQTGTWADVDVRAVAQIQEEYGLLRDGKVGDEMFRFLNTELRLEGLPTDDAHCITQFFVIQNPTTFTAQAGGGHLVGGHFQVRAQFPARCNCAQFQYRQFIRGTFTLTRGGVVNDLANIFSRIPGGQLPAAFVEDGDTSDNPVNYGHRDNPADNNPEDHYVNGAGTDDQAAGCRYRNEDFPGATVNTQAGDRISANIEFRGELQRNGRVVRTLRWTAVRGTFTVP